MGRTPPGQTRARIFAYLREQLLAGRSPTVREIRDAFGFRATQTVHAHLKALVEQGRLVQERGGERGRSRGYRLPRRPGMDGAVHLVPLLGGVQAGELTAAIEEPQGYLTVRGRGGDELFGLRVRGESMIDAGILPGDIVIVRKQADAEDGDIVVAMVEGDATIKRLRRCHGRIELHPENPDFTPIVPDPIELVLLGKVLQVRRFLEPGGLSADLDGADW